MANNDSAERGIGYAVEHLSSYYRHMATVSAGAIVVIGTFVRDFARAGSDATLPTVAVMSLGACVLVSTYMMWAYGVARRQVAPAEGETGAAWAYQVDERIVRLAKIYVRIGSFFGPAFFVVGFVALAWYASQSL